MHASGVPGLVSAAPHNQCTQKTNSEDTLQLRPFQIGNLGSALHCIIRHFVLNLATISGPLSYSETRQPITTTHVTISTARLRPCPFGAQNEELRYQISAPHLFSREILNPALGVGANRFSLQMRIIDFHSNNRIGSPASCRVTISRCILVSS